MLPVELFKLLMVVNGSLPIMNSNHEEKKPAFLASLKSKTPLGTNMVVKFDNVHTNIGNGYNPNTGIFTAPSSGVYQFSCNFIKSDNSFFTELDLMKNDKPVVKAHAHNAAFSSGSLQAILDLKKGERIYIIHPRQEAILYGDDYSMFSGHML